MSLNPMDDTAAEEVIAAFEAAEAAKKPTVECYSAAIDAWRRIHPDQTPTYAAGQAVAVIQAEKRSLRADMDR